MAAIQGLPDHPHLDLEAERGPNPVGGEHRHPPAHRLSEAGTVAEGEAAAFGQGTELAGERRVLLIEGEDGKAKGP